MNFNFVRGQRLILELTDKNLLEGAFEFGTKHQIDLVNIIDFETRSPIQGRLTFYQHEIVAYKTIESDDSPESTDSDNVSVSSPQKSNVIALPEVEYERLQSVTHNYLYFATADKRYVEAIEHLNSCENIGIVGLGFEFGPTKPIDLMVLSSWDQIYIFDLFSYQYRNFPPDLKEILQSQYIKKVGHSLAKLAETLWHCHRVRMNNVFDTQLADIELEKRNSDDQNNTIKERSLSECLTVYFNFPSSVVDNAGDITSSKWKERPLSDSRKIKASMLAVYLITLKNKLEYLLLKDFYNEMDSLINNIYKCTTYQGCVKFKSTGITNGVRQLSTK